MRIGAFCGHIAVTVVVAVEIISVIAVAVGAAGQLAQQRHGIVWIGRSLVDDIVPFVVSVAYVLPHVPAAVPVVEAGVAVAPLPVEILAPRLVEVLDGQCRARRSVVIVVRLHRVLRDHVFRVGVGALLVVGYLHLSQVDPHYALLLVDILHPVGLLPLILAQAVALAVEQIGVLVDEDRIPPRRAALAVIHVAHVFERPQVAVALSRLHVNGKGILVGGWFESDPVVEGVLPQLGRLARELVIFVGQPLRLIVVGGVDAPVEHPAFIVGKVYVEDAVVAVEV